MRRCGGRGRLGALVPAVLLVVLGAGPAGAQAPALACGAVLTEDTTLTADLVGCPGSALVVGADRITVDLGGFVLDGGLVGIDNAGGHDGVTVRNGTVRGFSVAVQLTGADRNLLTGLVVDFNASGIRVLGGDGNRVEANEVTDNGIGGDELGVGISLRGLDGEVSEGNVIARNRSRGNRYRGIEVVSGTVVGTLIEGNTQESDGANPLPGYGALVVSWGPGDIRDTVVRGNSWTASGGATITGEQATGTLLEGNVSGAARVSSGRAVGFRGFGLDTTIRFNEIVNSGTGVDIEPESRGARIVANRFLDNTPAINVGGTGTAVEANLVKGGDSSNFGILVLAEATGTTVRASAVSGTGEGIWVFGRGVTVESNYVADNDYEGIHVFDAAVDTRVTANYAVRNRTGIQVEGADATLTGNVANANRELGIAAPDGPTDGGANRARRNGDPAQCTGVPCSR